MTIHSPAQRAAQAVTRQKWGRFKGPRKKYAATPVTRIPSTGICGPMIKVIDADTRSLIDDAMRKRASAQAES